MARVENGRFTARIDEPFVVFMIGMWLPHHEGPARGAGGRDPRAN